MGFNAWDYLVLGVYLAGLMLIAARFIREDSSSTFFVAGHSIPWWGAGMSILATLVSTVSILGGPADFFCYGLEGFGIWWLATFLAAPVIIFVFIRFYLNLGIVSAYEYLERRFALPIRLLGGGFFLLMRGLYIGVVIYASAIALEPLVGIPVWALMLIVGLCSALYAVIGGIKAVIWTDVIQLVVIYLGIFYLFGVVLHKIDGGLPAIWNIASEHGKDFSYLATSDYWGVSPFHQNTFFLLVVGMFFNALAQKGTDQMTVQRYLATNNARASAKALLVDVIGAIPIGLVVTLVAMGLFAWYRTTPGLEHLKENNYNGVLPYFIATEFPHGLIGFFAAALMAAVISTVDSGMNCLATVTMTDFHQRFSKRPFSGPESLAWARAWTLIWAAACIGFAFFIYATAYDNIARVSGQVIGLFSGSILGIFLLGMLVPRSNAPGVGIGAAAGCAAAVWANYFWVKELPEGGIVHVSYAVPISLGVVITLLVGFGVSCAFPKPRKEQLEGLNIWHMTKREKHI